MLPMRVYDKIFNVDRQSQYTNVIQNQYPLNNQSKCINSEWSSIYAGNVYTRDFPPSILYTVLMYI